MKSLGKDINTVIQALRECDVCLFVQQALRDEYKSIFNSRRKDLNDLRAGLERVKTGGDIACIGSVQNTVDAVHKELARWKKLKNMYSDDAS